MLRSKMKTLVYRVLEKIANRIHPKNASGNNQSRM